MKPLKLKDNITARNSVEGTNTPDEIIKRIEETEEVLIKRVLKGDLDARENLIKYNEKIVIAISKQYQDKDLSIEELIKEGKNGLLMALDKFDESRGFKFFYYAVWWIRQSMINAIEENKKGRR